LINITPNITIWPYTERARAVSRGQFPHKSATFLGKLANTNLVCANTNSVCASWASCSEVEFLLLFWENPILIFPKKWYFFWEISLLPNQFLLSKCNTVSQGWSGVRFPPGLLSLGRSFSWVWTCIFWIWRARARSFPRLILQKFVNFGTFTPSPTSQKFAPILGLLPRAQFSQIFATFLGLFPNTNFGNFWIYRMRLSLFWIHHRVHMGPLSLGRSFCCVWHRVFWMLRARGGFPSPIFPKICHNFGTFRNTNSVCTSSCAEASKFTTFLGIFVLRFRYFEFTACVYRSFEFTIRFETCISDFGGYSTTLLGTASTKTSCLQIFQACWSWVRVSFWCRWLCIGKAADIGSPC